MRALPQDALLDLAELDAPPEPPRYLVAGLIERGGVTLLAGDSGTAKSILAADLAIAVSQGRPWLGRAVEAGGIVYLDCENPRRLALRRLRALGLRSADAGFHYWRRPPIQLSDPQHAAALHEEVKRQRPDLLVIDTAITASGIDVNDNSAVAALYASVFRRLAEDHDLAVVILHHEAKAYVGERSTASAGRAALGAMSWRGQADLHLAVELPQNPREPAETTPSGNVRERYRVRLRLPKVRDYGDSTDVEDVLIESERTPERALLSMSVRSEARHEATATPSREQQTAEQIAALLNSRAAELERAVIARELDADPTHGTFKRALAHGVSHGLFTSPRRGVYAPKGPTGQGAYKGKGL